MDETRDATLSIRVPARCWALDLPLRVDVAEQLVARAQHERSRLGDQWLGEVLGFRLLGALIQGLSSVNQAPPTDAQLKYALDLAARYGVSIPQQALVCRGAMGAFLSSRITQIRSSGL